MPERSRLVNFDQLKAEIQEALPMSGVASRLAGVDLEPAGDQERGLCPLHGENTPSFYVNDYKNVYHCYGCKEGGDAIDLVRKVRNLSFTEALYLMAAEADVDIEKYERPMTEAERIVEQLRVWSEGCLSKADPKKVERASVETAKAFGVGVLDAHPQQYADLPSYFQDKDYLLKGTVFPFRMPSGRLVGWKIREKPGEEKHFTKTPRDFPLDDATLFGIQVARDHLAENGHELVVIEGEYDTLACHDKGFKNTVGMGGSAFTDEQMQMCEDLHVRSIVFVFDGDKAGYESAEKIARKHWQSKIQIRICHMPDGHDPESFLAEFPDVSYQVQITGARHALEWMLWREWARIPRETLTSKLEFVSWIQAEFGQQLTRTSANLVFEEVANWLDLPSVDVQDFVRGTEGQLQAVDSERVLLGRAIRDQVFYIDARKRIVADDFFLMKHQRIWQVLESMMSQGLAADVATTQKFAEVQAIEPALIMEIAQTGDTNLDFHENQVVDLSLRRKAREDALAFRTDISDLNLDTDQVIGNFTHEVTAKVLRRESPDRNIVEQVDKAMDVLHERMKNPNAIHGLNLGAQQPNLTAALQGLQPRRLVVVAANSRRGKSTLITQWAAALSVGAAIPTDLISLEMDELELLYKIASHLTQIDSLAITGGSLNAQQLKGVERAMLKIRKSPLRIYTPDDMCPSEFLLYAREQRMQRRSEVFFFDYVQLASPERGSEKLSRYEQIGQFSRTAKMNIARGMECTVVVCAQMRREAADKERPTGEDVGDSYQIVRDSDVFIIIQGNDESTTSDVWLDKNRQGAGNQVFPTQYKKATQTFREASGGVDVPEYGVPVV